MVWEYDANGMWVIEYTEYWTTPTCTSVRSREAVTCGTFKYVNIYFKIWLSPSSRVFDRLDRRGCAAQRKGTKFEIEGGGVCCGEMADVLNEI